MFFRAIAGGFKLAVRRPGLVLLLWTWHTGLALVAVVPFWSWARSATALSPDTDVLLPGIQLGTLIELLQQHGAALPTLVLTVVALTALTMVSNAFVAGGTLEVLAGEGDERALLHRFFRGAGHFFSRSLRLLVTTCLAMVAGAGLVAAGTTAVLRPISGHGWEPGAFIAGLATLTLVGLVAGVCLLALDYSRVILVSGGGPRGMVRTWFRAIRFVLVHPLSAGVAGAGFFALVLAAVMAGAWVPAWVGGGSWAGIVTATVVQQLFVAGWIAVRMWQLASEIELYRLATPPAPEPETLIEPEAPRLEPGQALSLEP